MIVSKNTQINKDLAEIHNVDIYLIRSDNNTYFEAVLLKSKLPDLLKILEKIFKAATWPSQQGISAQIENIIDGFGGVKGNQSLYFLREKEYYVCAMLWPWQDGEHITVKIFHG